MASTYSSLKIQLMATGENSGTWGNVTNDNLGIAIEEAIAESADVAFSSSNVSLSLTDTNGSQTARNLRLNLTGTGLGSDTGLTVPDIEKPYIINNGLSDAVVVKNSTGSNVTVPAGKTMWVYSTGSGVTEVVNHLNSPTMSSATITSSNISSSNISSSNITAPVVLTSLTLNAQAPVRFADSDSSNYVAFAAPATVASDVTWTLPSADGSSGQVISTNGSAGLSFANVVNSATAGTGVAVSGATGNVTFSIGQAVATTSNVQFASLGVNTAASGTAGEIRATDNITAYYSDERLKTRLGPIENAVDKVCQLSGFYYEANEVAQQLGYKVKREVGVSAQEVQAVLPEIVVPAPIDEKYYTVYYEKIIPLLIEAIKELKSDLENLKNGN